MTMSSPSSATSLPMLSANEFYGETTATSPPHLVIDDDYDYVYQLEKEPGKAPKRPMSISTPRKLLVGKARIVNTGSAVFNWKQKYSFMMFEEEIHDPNRLSDTMLRRRNDFMAFWVLVSIALMVAMQVIDDIQPEIHKNMEHNLQDRILLHVYHAIKGINIVITLLLLLCLIEYYVRYTLVRMMKDFHAHGFSGFCRTFWNTTLKYKFIAEFCVMSIVPIPYLEHIWGLGDKIGLFMFLRLYIFVRVIRDHSLVYQKRHQIIKSNKQFARKLPQFGWQLTLRVMFYEYGLISLVSTTLLCLFISSLCLWVVERQDANPDAEWNLASYLDCLYFAMETMTTVGYGDFHPETRWGKFVCMVAAVFGIIIATIASAVIINKLSPTEEQTYAVNYLKRQRHLKKQVEAAVRLIQLRWRQAKQRERALLEKEQRRQQRRMKQRQQQQKPKQQQQQQSLPLVDVNESQRPLLQLVQEEEEVEAAEGFVDDINRHSHNNTYYSNRSSNDGDADNDNNKKLTNLTARYMHSVKRLRQQTRALHQFDDNETTRQSFKRLMGNERLLKEQVRQVTSMVHELQVEMKDLKQSIQMLAAAVMSQHQQQQQQQRPAASTQQQLQQQGDNTSKT